MANGGRCVGFHSGARTTGSGLCTATTTTSLQGRNSTMPAAQSCWYLRLIKLMCLTFCLDFRAVDFLQKRLRGYSIQAISGTFYQGYKYFGYCSEAEQPLYTLTVTRSVTLAVIRLSIRLLDRDVEGGARTERNESTCAKPLNIIVPNPAVLRLCPHCLKGEDVYDLAGMPTRRNSLTNSKR